MQLIKFLFLSQYGRAKDKHWIQSDVALNLKKLNKIKNIYLLPR